MLGIGGGGDVVGALAPARLAESLGTPAVLGGVAWERFAIDPHPGPWPLEQVRGARPVAARAALCGAETTTGSGVPFAEAGIARHLGAETVLVDVTAGAAAAGAGIAAAAAELGCDLVVYADVGGDVLATGSESGLASPLCDAIMLAAAGHAGIDAIVSVIGSGCDGELTPAEVLARIAVAAEQGLWIGSSSLSPALAAEIEATAAVVPTEASLMAARCARGAVGSTSIRDGRRTVPLGPIGAMIFHLALPEELERIAPLAAAVASSPDLEAARAALEDRGVRTELDYERDRAAAPPG